MTDTRPVLAIVVPDLYHASVSFFHEHIAATLPGRTVVVHISSNGQKAETDVPVLEIERARDWREPSIPVLSTLVRQANEYRRHHLSRAQRDHIEAFFRQHDVTHVMAEFANTGVMIAPVARKMGLPLTSISHGWDINVIGQMPQWQMRYRRYFASGARLGSAGEWLRDRMIEMGAPEETQVVPCAIHADSFRVTDHDNAGPVRVAMVSRLTAQKGPLQSVEAFALAVSGQADAILEIVGDGPQMAEIRTMIDRLGLGDRCVVHGAVTHEVALDVLARSHIFLQHGMTLPRQGVETQAVSLLEAMGHGLVPITTDHGGMNDHVLQGVRGWKVAEGDVHGMAEHIIWMINDPQTRATIGQAARRYVLEGYTADKVYPKLRQLIGIA